MGLTVEDTLARVDEINAINKYWEHPMWKGLLEGTHTQPMLQVFARQHAIIPLHNHNYHGRLYVICPDSKWREMIAEVVYEEGTGRLYANGVSHNDLWYRFGEGLGVSREDMDATEFSAGALAFKAYFQNMCEKSFLEGVAAHMLAAEAQGPGYFSHIASNLKERFGLTDEQVAFWVVHDFADADHSSVGRELLEQFAGSEEDFQTVIRVVQETVDVMNLLYDATWRYMQDAA